VFKNDNAKDRRLQPELWGSNIPCEAKAQAQGPTFKWNIEQQ